MLNFVDRLYGFETHFYKYSYLYILTKKKKNNKNTYKKFIKITQWTYKGKFGKLFLLYHNYWEKAFSINKLIQNTNKIGDAIFCRVLYPRQYISNNIKSILIRWYSLFNIKKYMNVLNTIKIKLVALHQIQYITKMQLISNIHKHRHKF